MAARGPSPEEAAAEFFGIPVSQVPPRSDKRRQFDQEHQQIDAWLREFIEPAEKRRWLAAGVANEELELVLEWRRCGMTVEDLAVTWPSGASTLDHIRAQRGKHTIEQIAAATRKRKLA